jgi:hypothetical protein
MDQYRRFIFQSFQQTFFLYIHRPNQQVKFRSRVSDNPVLNNLVLCILGMQTHEVQMQTRIKFRVKW